MRLSVLFFVLSVLGVPFPSVLLVFFTISLLGAKQIKHILAKVASSPDHASISAETYGFDQEPAFRNLRKDSSSSFRTKNYLEAGETESMVAATGAVVTS